MKNERKMSRLEKKEYHKLLKTKKATKQLQKKVATTLKWMDLQSVEDDCIIIGKEKKYFIKGIKLTPHNIFIDEMSEQRARVDAIRLVLNQMPDEVWFEFPYSKINADNWINQLNAEARNETDQVVSRMIEADLEKIYDFQKYNREKEFMLLIRDTDEKRLQKNLEDLYRLWTNAGFSPKVLNRRDFYSLISFYFENSLITDYTFSRGIFSYMNVQYELDLEKDQYQKVDYTDTFAKLGSPITNVKPSENIVQKSKIAPLGLRVRNKNIELGDKLIKCILITQLPPVYTLGMLTDFLNDPSIKLFMKSKKSNDDISAMLNKDLRNMKERYAKSKDEMEKQRIITELESQQTYINDVIRKSDRTHDLTIIFQVIADDEKELRDKTDKLRSVLSLNGFRFTFAPLIQEALFKICTPLFIKSGLPSIIEENISLPQTSDGIAGLYPFIFETLNDSEGFLLGEELQNGGKIFLDTFYYLHNSSEAGKQNRLNGNFCIVGSSGSGKTTLTALVVRSLIRKKTYTIWIDPESKNEKLTQMYGGTFVDWGKRGNVINVFDLKPIDVDEGEDDSLMWDTALAIDKVIQDVTILFQFLFPQIEEDAISFIGGIVKMAYEEVGIKPDDNGKYQSFKGYTREQYPTFETFNACLLKVRDAMHNKGDGYQDDVKLLNSLSRKMFRILNEWSVYLNGHTTINVNPNGRNIVSFGTKELFNAPQELKNALYYLMFNYSWTLCLNDKIESAFIVDEAHDVIQTSHTAKMVAQFVRRSRKYRNLMFIITQEPEDFAADNVIMHTRAMFNNSAYKIIMKLNKDATEGLEKLQDINENETFWVKNGFQQGDALLILGDRRIPIHVIATQNELWEMGAMLSSGKSN